jgi:hypothetical protein
MLTTYRIVYGLVLSILLGNILRTNYVATAPVRVSILLIAVAASLFCLFILLLGFHRIPATVFWVLVAVCEALFIWYAWFSPASPFILHEAHNLDAAAAARENTMHYIIAGAVFAFLFSWFLSLPIIRSICERHTTVRV